jgi:hypothetical protein
VSTDDLKAVIASVNSRVSSATGGVVMGSTGCRVDDGDAGGGGIIAGSMNSAIWSAMGGIFNSDDCLNTGGISTILGSWNVELFTPFAVGGGYDSGATVTKTDANQNLSWLIKSNGGHAHFAGNLKIGGDPNTGSAGFLEVTGANGDLNTAGHVRAYGALEVGDDGTGGHGPLLTVDPATGDLATEGSGQFKMLVSQHGTTPSAVWVDGFSRWETTLNKPHGTIEIVNDNDHDLMAGVEYSILVNNSVAEAGHVYSCFATVSDYDGTDFTPAIVSTMANGGMMLIKFQNTGTLIEKTDNWSITIRFFLVGEGA